MRILSIDVGIKHLAFCLLVNNGVTDDKQVALQDSFSIMKWDSLNVAEAVEYKCSLTDKEGKPCQQQAKFKKGSQAFCLKHAKKQSFHIPTSTLTPAFIKKQKTATLYELLDKYNIVYTKPISKLDLQSLLLEYIYTSCFEPIIETNASKVDLVTIGRNMMHQWDSVLCKEDGIEKVIIENQISPIANRMKTIQGMIAQYFIMRYENIDIVFVNASNKLKTLSQDEKESSGSKMTYNERKKRGIEKTLEYIKKNDKWQSYFKQHKKKDDLADSFLQGMWYLSSVSE